MLSALISSILPVVSTVIDRVVPDKAAQAKAKRALEKALVDAEMAGQLGQLEINKIEAGSRSTFIAGWRPFIGWTCGAAMAYSYVLQPVLVFGLGQAGYLVTLPQVELGEMMPVLLGMLGLGGLRSFEKFKGVSR
tara:strand:- start:1746 stop:2150 length:405 start_codon:yes stop_codon:yes gene_type:complete